MPGVTVWDVASDGRFVGLANPEPALPPESLLVVTDWLDELRSRAPGDR